MEFNKLDIASIILLCGAIVVVAVTLHREYGVGSTGEEQTQFYVSGWDSLTVAGNTVGSRNAPIKILEFFDYQCASCHRMERVLSSIRREYHDTVSITRFYLPLRSHPAAFSSAVSAECALRQSQFTRFHHVLFENHGVLLTVPLDSLAREAGVNNLRKFRKCIASRKTVNTILRHKRIANKLGITSTPSIIINGAGFNGYIPIDSMRYLIDKRIEDY